VPAGAYVKISITIDLQLSTLTKHRFIYQLCYGPTADGKKYAIGQPIKFSFRVSGDNEEIPQSNRTVQVFLVKQQPASKTSSLLSVPGMIDEIHLRQDKYISGSVKSAGIRKKPLSPT